MERVTVKLPTILRQVEYPFQLLDLLRSRACRELMRQAVLNESLTVFIANILHVDIAHARDEISHGLCPVLE